MFWNNPRAWHWHSGHHTSHIQWLGQCPIPHQIHAHTMLQIVGSCAGHCGSFLFHIVSLSSLALAHNHPVRSLGEDRVSVASTVAPSLASGRLSFASSAGSVRGAKEQMEAKLEERRRSWALQLSSFRCFFSWHVFFQMISSHMRKISKNMFGHSQLFNQCSKMHQFKLISKLRDWTYYSTYSDPKRPHSCLDRTLS